jgi:hypothetical protein
VLSLCVAEVAIGPTLQMPTGDAEHAHHFLERPGAPGAGQRLKGD